MASVTIKAIGTIKNELKEAKRGGRDVVSEIVLDDSLTDALDHLDEFSNILVFFWIEREAGQYPKELRVYPHNDTNNPLAGIFATNSTDRPNPVGMSIAEIVERKGNVLKVTGLGVVNGTPLIDIKPYIPRIYSLPDAKMGSWLTS